MRDRDGGIDALGHEEEGQRFTHNETASDHDHIGSAGFDPGLAEETDTPTRSAGHKAGRILHHELADIDRMKAIHILARIDEIDDLMFIDLGWRGRLHENSVDGLFRIEITHHLEHFLLGGIHRELDLPGIDSHLPALPDLGIHIDLRSWIFSDQHDRQSGGDSLCFQGFDLFLAPGQDVSGDFFSVENGHLQAGPDRPLQRIRFSASTRRASKASSSRSHETSSNSSKTMVTLLKDSGMTKRSHVPTRIAHPNMAWKHIRGGRVSWASLRRPALSS